MLFRLISREARFFDYLEELSEYCVLAAKKIFEVFEYPERASERHRELKDEIEKRADGCVKKICEKAASTFITPLDREDIVWLARKLDDVVDKIESAGRRMKIFAKHGGNFDAASPLLPQTEKSIHLLLVATEALREAVASLRKTEVAKVEKWHTKIHAAENQGDDLWEGDGGVLEIQTNFLFENQELPLTRGEFLRLRWEGGVCHKLEDALDSAKEAADCIASILMKYA